MKTIEEMLKSLARPDVLEFGLVSNRLPSVNVGGKFEPVDNKAPNTDAILQMLVAMGGSRYVESLSAKPTQWTARLDGVGVVAIAAIMRDDVVQARFTLAKREDAGSARAVPAAKPVQPAPAAAAARTAPMAAAQAQVAAQPAPAKPVAQPVAAQAPPPPAPARPAQAPAPAAPAPSVSSEWDDDDDDEPTVQTAAPNPTPARPAGAPEPAPEEIPRPKPARARDEPMTSGPPSNTQVLAAPVAAPPTPAAEPSAPAEAHGPATDKGPVRKPTPTSPHSAQAVKRIEAERTGVAPAPSDDEFSEADMVDRTVELPLSDAQLHAAPPAGGKIAPAAPAPAAQAPATSAWDEEDSPDDFTIESPPEAAAKPPAPAPAAPAAAPVAPAAPGSAPAVAPAEAPKPVVFSAPPPPPTGEYLKLGPYLALALAQGASDVHLVADRPLLLRIASDLAPQGETLSPAAVTEVVRELVPPRLQGPLDSDGSCDFAIAHPQHGRFRVNVSRQRTGYKVSLRVIAAKVPTLKDLGLPDAMSQAVHHHQGLIVITGPTGHGKTSTLAAVVDLINSSKSGHILTVEDPIEYMHTPKRSMVSQREVGAHTKTFAAALKGSLRQDPDVIVVGELRDTETVRMAVSASETGHLVVGTMNTPSAAKTIDRIIDMFPPADQQQMRITLSSSLRLIVSQRLVPSTDRRRLHVAAELLPGSVPLSNLIRDNRTFQIPSLQQRGKAFGIIRLDESLAELVQAGKITLDTAKQFAEAPQDLEALAARSATAAAAPKAADKGGAEGAKNFLAEGAKNLFGKK
jgi:twitching motility protein PilT